jgi:hypothetical protein
MSIWDDVGNLASFFTDSPEVRRLKVREGLVDTIEWEQFLEWKNDVDVFPMSDFEAQMIEHSTLDTPWGKVAFTWGHSGRAGDLLGDVVRELGAGSADVRVLCVRLRLFVLFIIGY